MQLKHLAIMMDGNGRWAKKRGLERAVGHIEGEKTFESICKIVASKGIKYLTVFAFSTENWNRPLEEVNGIMQVLEHFFSTSAIMAHKHNFRISVIGDRTKLSKSLVDAINFIENDTNKNDSLHIQIAVNYGGTDEILRAINKCIAKNDKTEIVAQDITENLDTQGTPYPDLMIRTGGEIRLSNFMMWQLAYTELYFTDVLWPDFNEIELNKALDEYSTRNRRYGMIKSL